MKIAVASDDGTSVSQHFGRASSYVVFSVEEGKVTGREVRSKAHHHGTEPEHGRSRESGSHHGGHNHGGMVSPIADCAVVLAAGMGQGAYDSMRAQGIEPAFVRAGKAEDGVADYLAGRTIDHPLCRH